MPRLTAEHLAHFMNPTSVAVVGASTRTGPGSYNILENMLREGMRPRLFPVNPRAAEVLGLKAYPSARELPEPVDLAVITVAREHVVRAVGDCVARGIDSVIIVTQGFADADEQGRRYQEEIASLIAGTPTRVIGPNSIGVANALDGFHTSFQKFDLRPRPIAMICQSGMFILASAEFSTGLGLGVDIGNALDLGFPEMLQALGGDPRIQVLNLHMESLARCPEFLEAAAAITPTKPVLVFKSGQSEEGARAAASHSGAMAGEEAAFGAAFEKAGILQVQTLGEMADLNRALLTYPGIRGKRVAVVALSGGGGIAALDALSEAGLTAARLGPATLAAIQAMNPPWAAVANPVDTWMACLKLGLAPATREIVRLLLEDDGVDAVVVLLNAYRTTGFEVLGGAIEGIVAEAAARRDKPVALWAFGLNQGEVIARAEESGIVAGFAGPERAARALAGLHFYHHRVRSRPAERAPELTGLDRPRAAAVLAQARAAGVLALGSRTQELLAAYGIPAAPARFAPSREAAQKLADEIGFPLVMKIVSPQILHKSDASGVRLNLRSPEEIGQAFVQMMASARALQPTATLEGVVLQPFLQGGTEVLVGARRSDFGPLVIFGLGGIFTEVLKDVAFALAPLSPTEARALIARTRAAALLAGARGAAPADIEALVDILCRLSRLMLDLPELAEIDLNPVLARADGAVVLDARAILVPCPKSPALDFGNLGSSGSASRDHL